MLQHVLDFKQRIDSGEIVFEINKEFFLTKKIYLLTKWGEKEYHVKIEYAVNETLRTVREDVKTFTDFQQAYDSYVGINTTHNLYTKAGKEKIETDNEAVKMVDINSVVIPEIGKNTHQTNLEKIHTVPLGSLVELETGVRLFVVEHVKDFDGTPLYNLCHDKDWKEGNDVQMDNTTIPGENLSRRALSLHHPVEGFEVITKPTNDEEVEYAMACKNCSDSCLNCSDQDILEKLKLL